MKVLDFIAFFCFGFFSCMLLFSYSLSMNVEFPFGTGEKSNISSPTSFISEDDIIIKKDMIILMVSNASISRYSATGSMSPVLDAGTNGIRVVPQGINEINIGDIISFNQNGRLIVHRVIDKGEDVYGTYFITAGDNNDFNDGKIRFNDIKYKTIGLLY